MGRGGKRIGAGRPKGSGKYGEPTKAMRVPQSLANQLEPILKNWQTVAHSETEQSNFSDSEAILQTLRFNSPESNVQVLAPSVAQLIPLYSHSVAAGLPASVDEAIEEKLDLNAALTRDPSRSFCVRANGDSMIDAGIQDGDVMLVDTSIEASDNDIVIAVVNSELTVKRLRQTPDNLWLQPENVNYPAIIVTEETDLRVLGVVTCTIHQFMRPA
ncbi:MAG: translesion error-prone DNA polymerase V autoproteolytic subunit [Coleofasciculaceae cyanobacterium RL_1_1]|nr:translesion error-prone DNA polymerase V autoproteolytic subunit [Coleofasciculaceae cyanobacterium RL_1_1]